MRNAQIETDTAQSSSAEEVPLVGLFVCSFPKLLVSALCVCSISLFSPPFLSLFLSLSHLRTFSASVCLSFVVVVVVVSALFSFDPQGNDIANSDGDGWIYYMTDLVSSQCARECVRVCLSMNFDWDS